MGGREDNHGGARRFKREREEIGRRFNHEVTRSFKRRGANSE